MQQNPTESLRRMPGEAIDGGRASPSSSASSSSASSSSSSSSGAEVLGEGGGGGGGGGSAKTTSSESSDVCRYFSRGMCRFGEMCRFAHILGENVWAANLYTPSLSSKATIVPIHNSRGGEGGGSSNPTEDDPIAPQPTTSSFTTTTIIPSDPSSWVLAPVFVPNKQRPPSSSSSSATSSSSSSFPVVQSYAQVVGDQQGGSTNNNNTTTNHHHQQQQLIVIDDDTQTPLTNAVDMQRINSGASVLCPYFKTESVETGDQGAPRCRYGDRCVYDHGELCEMCGRWCLSPSDTEQRKAHELECMKQHELNMELSFALARSKDKTCGVCFEVIIEKSGREQRFGILPNCNHIFCLECIRKWRLAKQFDNKITRACPECRVTSDFVCPSVFWVDTKEEKEKLLADYRVALGEKDCKYFKKGNGKCPFGNKCFYKHALANGTRVNVGVPQRAVRRPRNYLGEVDTLEEFFLWDFLDERDHQWLGEQVFFSDDDHDDDDDLEHLYNLSINRYLARTLAMARRSPSPE